MSSTTRFAPNADEAVSKVFDDEVIIINLVTGAYYSTSGSGAAIWKAVEERRSVSEIVERIVGEFDVEADAARQDVERVLRELADELLIRPAGDEPSLPAPALAAAAKRAYVPPSVDIYREMRDLLALDPPMPVLGEPPLDWGADRDS